MLMSIYAKQIVSHIAPHRTVCVNFCRAQSSEMWDRMVHELGKLWGNKDKVLNSLWDGHLCTPWDCWYINKNPQVPACVANNNVIEVSIKYQQCIHHDSFRYPRVDTRASIPHVIGITC